MNMNKTMNTDNILYAVYDELMIRNFGTKVFLPFNFLNCGSRLTSEEVFFEVGEIICNRAKRDNTAD